LAQVYSSSSLDGRAIVFCETKKEADQLSVSHEIKAEAHVLHGDIPQDKRELVLQVGHKWHIVRAVRTMSSMNSSRNFAKENIVY
jgi:hypothetical protein